MIGKVLTASVLGLLTWAAVYSASNYKPDIVHGAIQHEIEYVESGSSHVCFQIRLTDGTTVEVTSFRSAYPFIHEGAKVSFDRNLPSPLLTVEEE
ncbi:MAG TPA: hypothetical protein V6C86_24245 [Oculatellaceae cyanobacterium]